MSKVASLFNEIANCYKEASEEQEDQGKKADLYQKAVKFLNITVEYCDKVPENMKGFQEHMLKGQALLQLGDYYKEEMSYDLAEDYFSKAEDYYEKVYKEAIEREADELIIKVYEFFKNNCSEAVSEVCEKRQ